MVYRDPARRTKCFINMYYVYIMSFLFVSGVRLFVCLFVQWVIRRVLCVAICGLDFQEDIGLFCFWVFGQERTFFAKFWITFLGRYWFIWFSFCVIKNVQNLSESKSIQQKYKTGDIWKQIILYSYLYQNQQFTKWQCINQASSRT